VDHKRKFLEIVPYSEFLSDKNNRFIKLRYKDRLNENNENRKEEMSSLKFMEKLKR
jgi:hypothetical protein